MLCEWCREAVDVSDWCRASTNGCVRVGVTHSCTPNHFYLHPWPFISCSTAMFLSTPSPLSVLTTIFQVDLGQLGMSILDFIEAGWWRWWVVTTGATRRAKTQSNYHHQQINIQLFFPGWMHFLSPNESTEGKDFLLTSVNLTQKLILADYMSASCCDIWFLLRLSSVIRTCLYYGFYSV